MNSFRNVLRAVLALIVVMFSLSGFAAAPISKNFGVVISPLIVPPVGTTTLDVAYSNTSPPASNSTINSTILTLPANSGLTIQGIGVPSGVTAACTLSSDKLQVKCAGFTGVKPGDPPFVLNVYVTAVTGCHEVTWGAQAFAGNSWSGDKFNFTASASNLVTEAGCEQFTGSVTCGNILTGLPVDASGYRALYNKDGSTCQLVNYNFTNTVNIDAGSILQWDTQPSAVFSVTLTAKPTEVDATGWPAVGPRPQVAWDFNPISGKPINKTYGVACLNTTLPTPYGRLVSAIGTGDTAITVDTTMAGAIAFPPSPATFPLIIGTERMQGTVQSVSGSQTTVTVIRGAGNLTSPYRGPDSVLDAAAHGAGDIVMSTPLPIDPNPKLPNFAGDGGFSTTDNPYYQKQAQICVAARGWTAYDVNPSTGVQRVRWWSTIYDIGDGWYSVGGGN
jgi:hypothetical protein